MPLRIVDDDMADLIDGASPDLSVGKIVQSIEFHMISSSRKVAIAASS